MGIGVVTFLYVGIVGGRAAGEVVVGLIGITLIASVVAMVGGVQDLRRKLKGCGIAALALGAIPIMLVVGMVILDKVARDERMASYARRDTSGYERDTKEKKDTSAPKAGAVVVDLHIMSQCPYGIPVENSFHEVADKLGAEVDVRLHYIGRVNPGAELWSMHGADEVTGDLAQVCAAKLSSTSLDFVVCQNKDSKAVATSWSTCAAEAAIPVEKMRTCMTGQEGRTLLEASFKLSETKGVRGSPTIYIDGVQYQGGRRTDDLLRAVCASYKGDKPAACDAIPDAPKVNVTILTDTRCADCDTGKVETSLRQKIANPVISKVDYASPEGTRLFETLEPIHLPAVIFDATLANDADASRAFSRGLRQAGDLKALASGTWDPSCADEGGCALDSCKLSLECRPEEPKKLDVFVMSECPFGVKGMNAMEDVLAHFRPKVGQRDFMQQAIDFDVHFIGTSDPTTGLASMHGPSEVEEDLREVCALEHYRQDMKFMRYFLCRNKDIKSPRWEACTGSTGIDANVIRACVDSGEGKRLLEASFRYSESTGMRASPTWLVNNKFKFNGIDAQTIESNLCQHNDLAGCDSVPAAQPPAQGQPAPGQPAPGCGG